ncbi:jg9802 [Pararge aegeria aegeria]|uniref:Jg9802 protein n=1 Tax=Pararge aegeria aegeria TaxID=348720 RepID=A0A8S4RLJ6_9NEOP|nr:jg9802 [Pararge aegeria aegeria]
MPPKKAPAATSSKKTEQKKKEKVIEDKTFGLKNKKGAKQQKFIQQVEKQVKSGGIHPAKPMDDKKKDKEQKLKEQKELSLLFKPVQTQKVEKGIDPKSVVCAFFKQGQCTKGDKCKFSHDLTIERKDALIKAEEQKRTDFKAGRAVGLSGREMFSFDPALAEDADDDDEAFDLRNYDQESDDDQDVTEYRNIELELIGMEASEVDDTGTKATEDRLHHVNQGMENGVTAPDDDNDDNSQEGAVPINENLFLDEDLDEELQNLDLED